jgi:hypothetical protein
LGLALKDSTQATLLINKCERGSRGVTRVQIKSTNVNVAPMMNATCGTHAVP